MEKDLLIKGILIFVASIIAIVTFYNTDVWRYFWLGLGILWFLIAIVFIVLAFKK